MLKTICNDKPRSSVTVIRLHSLDGPIAGTLQLSVWKAKGQLGVGCLGWLWLLVGQRTHQLETAAGLLKKKDYI